MNFKDSLKKNDHNTPSFTKSQYSLFYERERERERGREREREREREKIKISCFYERLFYAEISLKNLFEYQKTFFK